MIAVARRAHDLPHTLGRHLLPLGRHGEHDHAVLDLHADGLLAVTPRGDRHPAAHVLAHGRRHAVHADGLAHERLGVSSSFAIGVASFSVTPAPSFVSSFTVASGRHRQQRAHRRRQQHLSCWVNSCGAASLIVAVAVPATRGRRGYTGSNSV
jgi:hypothetical protein